jgi:hypothetical protein
VWKTIWGMVVLVYCPPMSEPSGTRRAWLLAVNGFTIIGWMVVVGIATRNSIAKHHWPWFWLGLGGMSILSAGIQTRRELRRPKA